MTGLGEMKRGEIWMVETVGKTRLVLIVQSDALTMVSPGFVSVPLYVEPPPTRSLIAPCVQGLYADASDMGRLLVGRFKEYRGAATEAEMEEVSTALKATLDLF